MPAPDNRLTFRKVWALARAVAREYRLSLPTLCDARYRYTEREPIPLVTSNENGVLWIDREYVAYALMGDVIRYVYVTRHHIMEEIGGYKVLEKLRENPPALPPEIMRQFRDAMRTMLRQGTQYFVAKEFMPPEEKNITGDSRME